ncbi:MAG: CdaR family protein [Oscillospiraceae bacterium]|nr:CdaR family protein [Oscillospiraceae bacterium]
MNNIVINFLKSFITNLRSIIFAVILAVIAWFAISFQLFPNVTKSFVLPVTANPTAFMLDDNLTLSEDFNSTVELRIQGKRYEIGGIRAEDFDAYLDFSKVSGPGEYVADIIFNKRDGIICEILNPLETKTVNIIQQDRKTLTIIPNISGVSAIEGMQIDYDNVVVNPSTVVIRGEKSLIDEVDRAEVVVTSSDVLIYTSELRGELIFYDKYGERIINNNILYENRGYDVTVPVFKQKTLPLDVSLINAPNNFDRASLWERMRIYPEELTLSSPDFSIDNHDVMSIGTVSLNELTLRDLQGGYSIIIELPEEYTNMTGINTAVLTFEDVDDYGQRVFEVSSDNFTTINVPAGYSVNYITKQISVKVVGPSSVIYEMSSADITMTINMAGIEISEGTRTIGVNFRIPGSNVEAWVVEEYRINIEIIKID